MSSRYRSPWGGRRTDRRIQLAQLQRPIPPAPVIPPVLDPWPEGYHAHDHLHPFDCTPADLTEED